MLSKTAHYLVCAQQLHSLFGRVVPAILVRAPLPAARARAGRIPTTHDLFDDVLCHFAALDEVVGY